MGVNTKDAPRCTPRQPRRLPVLLQALDRRRLRREALLAGALGTVVSLVAAVGFATSRLLRLKIEGVSMVPVLAPGDRVLVLRTDRITVGDIVVFSDPDGSDEVLVNVSPGSTGARCASRATTPARAGTAATSVPCPGRR